jgi:hypothetical protein
MTVSSSGKIVDRVVERSDNPAGTPPADRPPEARQGSTMRSLRQGVSGDRASKSRTMGWRGLGSRFDAAHTVRNAGQAIFAAGAHADAFEATDLHHLSGLRVFYPFKYKLVRARRIGKPRGFCFTGAAVCLSRAVWEYAI